MTLDEFEALRLADLEGLYQEEAARRMNVSRPTFSRIVDAARRKTADALVHGKALCIEGGPSSWARAAAAGYTIASDSPRHALPGRARLTSSGSRGLHHQPCSNDPRGAGGQPVGKPPTFTRKGRAP